MICGVQIWRVKSLFLKYVAAPCSANIFLQYLTRLPPKDLTQDGRWTRKPTFGNFGGIESPTYLSKYTPHVLGICRFYFLNRLTLLAPTQSADALFHSFTVLCENENGLISSLHCFFANVTPYPLVLHRETNISVWHLHFPKLNSFCHFSDHSVNLLRSSCNV